MKKNIRQSNLELLRILMMLVIIAHHYVVNSGLIGEITPSLHMIENSPVTSFKALFALCFGWGGKTAINVFILITGYFMCTQQFQWTKVLYLYLQVKLYTIVIFFLFLFGGRESFALGNMLTAFLGVAYNFPNGFIPAFIFLYILIPFLNKLISAMQEREFRILIGILLWVFTIIPTFSLNYRYAYTPWYITVYLIGAYIRLYMPVWLESRNYCLWLTFTMLVLSWASIVVIAVLGLNVPYYWFVSDSNKILAIGTAIALFCLFRTINIGSNRVINAFSSVTFGVLLIHANSDAMRQWLWSDVLHNVTAYHLSIGRFVIHAVASVFGVYIVCASIAIVLRKIIPLSKWINLLKKSFDL